MAKYGNHLTILYTVFNSLDIRLTLVFTLHLLDTSLKLKQKIQNDYIKISLSNGHITVLATFV